MNIVSDMPAPRAIRRVPKPYKPRGILLMKPLKYFGVIEIHNVVLVDNRFHKAD